VKIVMTCSSLKDGKRSYTWPVGSGFYRFQQIIHGAMAFQGMTKMNSLLKMIEISPTFFISLQDSRLAQFFNNALYSPFGYAHLISDISHTQTRITCQTN